RTSRYASAEEWGPGSARRCGGPCPRFHQWPGRARDGRMPSGECGCSELPCPITDAKEPKDRRSPTKNKEPPRLTGLRGKCAGRGGPSKMPAGRIQKDPASAAPILLRGLADNRRTDGPAALAKI